MRRVVFSECDITFCCLLIFGVWGLATCFPFPLPASPPSWPGVWGLSLETDLRRRAVLGVEGSKDPRLRDLSRDGVRGGELGGSERGLEEAKVWAPLRREGVEKA